MQRDFVGHGEEGGDAGTCTPHVLIKDITQHHIRVLSQGWGGPGLLGFGVKILTSIWDFSSPFWSKRNGRQRLR